jgi:two-component system alkaline phosphatase synthesis response regulator PhoP
VDVLPKPNGIIVADDDPLIRDILRAKLESLGQTVFQANNGTEATFLASRTEASLIILDVKMPRMDGLQACAQIRRLPGYAATPIVMLTFDDSEQTQRAATRAGATMFLVKPFGSAALMLALSRFLPIDEAAQQEIHAAAVRATGGRVIAKSR